MKWQHKYAIQKALSILPFNAGFYANQLLSRRFGGLRKKEFYGFPNTLAMVSLLEQLGFAVEGKRFIELGTGWDGSAAMGLLSLGAESVHTFDLFPHLDQALVEQVLESFADLSPFTGDVFPFEADLSSVAARCDRVRIDRSRFHYFAPHDARSLGLEDDFADYYYSQAVLEHVPDEVITALHRESFRALKPGGVAVHYVQPTMHGAWVDPTATGIDYLACSDRKWKMLYENRLAHENRLRGVDHVRRMQDAGFDIVREFHSVDTRALESLPKRILAPRFQHYTPEELATDYIWIVAQKPGASTS